jgi:hypothetical protein
MRTATSRLNADKPRNAPSSGRAGSRGNSLPPVNPLTSAIPELKPPAGLVSLQRLIADRSPRVVQTRPIDEESAAPPSSAHAIAAQGVAGGGSKLPHLDTVQAAFGRHDVRGISAHVGGAAAHASEALGARAYTTGDRVAFQSAPSLHTAAHEAAHTVQQRAGVSLLGGIGQTGDAYERHADLVAGAVVAGRSAESLLDQVPSGGGSSGAIQRLPPEDENAAAGGAAPEDAPPEETEGDKLRKAILESAERRLKEKTTIVSEERAADIREGMVRLPMAIIPGSTLPIEVRLPLKTPMKNFTTCIEFAGQTFGDASKVMGKDRKDAANIAKLLPGILKIFNDETQLNAMIAAFQKAVAQFDKPIGDAEAKELKAEVEKKNLQDSLTGDKKADLRADLQIKGKNAAIHAYHAAIETLKKEQAKFQAKVDKLQGELNALDAVDDAWVKPLPGLTNGRPKPGEYILIGAATKQAYGVSTETKVELPKGAFKHIAVFKSLEVAPSPKDKPDEKWEKWSTIDGGGTEARSTHFFIRLSDLRIQYLEPDKPWASSTNGLIGWIDMDKLVGTSPQGAGAAPAKA